MRGHVGLIRMNYNYKKSSEVLPRHELKWILAHLLGYIFSHSSGTDEGIVVCSQTYSNHSSGTKQSIIYI